MFKDNKYAKWYYQIIKQHTLSNKGIGIEGHHVLPRCMGGINDKSNICLVRAKVHFILHKLLVKMVITKEHKQKMNMLCGE